MRIDLESLRLNPLTSGPSFKRLRDRGLPHSLDRSQSPHIGAFLQTLLKRPGKRRPAMSQSPHIGAFLQTLCYFFDIFSNNYKAIYVNLGQNRVPMKKPARRKFGESIYLFDIIYISYVHIFTQITSGQNTLYLTVFACHFHRLGRFSNSRPGHLRKTFQFKLKTETIFGQLLVFIFYSIF